MRAVVIVSGGILIAGLAVAACGGSSSETPWPVEPDTRALGPAGEQGPGSAVDEHAPKTDGGARKPDND